MGTATNPEIYIQYYDADWVNLTSKSSRFEVRDAGLLKIPMATVDLLNPLNVPDKYDRLRIFVDVRGVADMIFYGRIDQKEKQPIAGTVGSYRLQLTCYGLEKRLKNDTITWDYAAEQANAYPDTAWTFKTMIEDFLVLPDSGYDTNMTLDSDNAAAVTSPVYGDCDFTRQSLLDAFRVVAETIGYDGYLYIDGADAKIKFWTIGDLSPPVVTVLADPFIGEPKLTESLDDIANYILVWGGVESGYPWGEDTFTERGYAKYTPKIWEAGPVSSITISDHEYTFEGGDRGPLHYDDTRTSCYCIETDQPTSIIRLRLRIDNTPMSKMDCVERYSSADFYLKIKGTGWNEYPVRAFLIDNAAHSLQYRFFEKFGIRGWHNIHLPLPRSSADISSSVKHDAWFDYQDFDLENVVNFDIYVEGDANSTGIMVDWFKFGGGLAIDPFKEIVLNPPVKDDASINAHGLSVYHHYNVELKSFDQAQDEGERVLNVLKDPVRTVTCTKLGLTWLRPNQIVVLNSNSLEITETWRTVELVWNWNSNGKIVYCTMNLVPQYAKTPPVFGYRGEMPAVAVAPSPSWYEPRAPPWI